ncbi:MAG: shikimate dehydrogenase [Anaerolineales bacterium]|nr:shikimate dehydrogenase [Anaerolineales bacterium]
MSGRIGLIGGEVGHSASPAMHRAALAELGLDWEYEARALPSEELPGFVHELRRGNWAGVNVTLPHKRQIVPLLDRLEREAEQIGAVNTVSVQGDKLIGYNTDAPGLRRDLERKGPALGGRPLLVLGAGGAARAAAWGLRRQCGTIHVIARTPSRARAWTLALEERHDAPVLVRPWEVESFRAVDPEVLIVQATPVGMWPHADRSPWPEDVPLPEKGVVYDLVYRPQRTRLVEQARRAGLAAWTGLGMLVEQGALALELWSQQQAPRTLMRAAAERALEVDLDRVPDGR